jgi:hypothetical protein
VTQVIGDRYGGEFCRERFTKVGIAYRVADKVKSDLYRELLPLLNSRRAELLDNPRLLAQLVGLERRTARGGRDSIDYTANAHDDVANAVAGAVAAALTRRNDFLRAGFALGLHRANESLRRVAPWPR